MEESERGSRMDGARQTKGFPRQNPPLENPPGAEGGIDAVEMQECGPESECAARPDGAAAPCSDTCTRARTSPSGKPARERSPRGRSPEEGGARSSPRRRSPRTGLASVSFNLSSIALDKSPPATCRSWRRSSLKGGTSRRKSLPPLHQDVAELNKLISVDLPEEDRLAGLLLASFQFSARKLEHVLKQGDGFNPEAFKANAASVSGELKRFTERLKLDGTLKRCVEQPEGAWPDPALDDTVTQIKESIARFTAERDAWDQLLRGYQDRAGEVARQLEECKLTRAGAEPPGSLASSQAGVVSSKPDYQKILDGQSQVFNCMELVLDEFHMAAKLLQAFAEETAGSLRSLSGQLAARTFPSLEESPARKLLKLLPETGPGAQPPTAECSLAGPSAGPGAPGGLGQ